MRDIETIKAEIQEIDKQIEQIENEMLKPLRDKKKELRQYLLAFQRNDAELRKVIEQTEKQDLNDSIMKLFFEGETKESIAAAFGISTFKVAREINKHYLNESVELYTQTRYAVDIRRMGYDCKNYRRIAYYAHIVSPQSGNLYVDNNANGFDTLEQLKKAVTRKINQCRKKKKKKILPMPQPTANRNRLS